MVRGHTLVSKFLVLSDMKSKLGLSEQHPEQCLLLRPLETSGNSTIP